ncbi:MAG TPA: cyclic nucleotide-binding domain-containing protein, partial [Agromyces sp.]
WGLPIALVGVFPQQAFALVLLSFVGVGNALVDVAGFTLIGRLAPDEVLARVFGVLESMVAVFVGLGGVVASSLIGWLGIQPALVAIGLLCPVLAAASWWRLRRLDRSVAGLDLDIGLLRGVAMLETLPLPSVEQLARGLQAVAVPAGATVFAQGEPGDRYYVIESGEADVVHDGSVVASLGPGEGFGEIALLRPTGRMATVVARSDLRLQSLSSDRFLPVVLGYTPSAVLASATVDGILAQYDPDERHGEPPVSA